MVKVSALGMHINTKSIEHSLFPAYGFRKIVQMTMWLVRTICTCTGPCIRSSGVQRRHIASRLDLLLHVMYPFGTRS